jgi:hypothetical protein
VGKGKDSKIIFVFCSLFFLESNKKKGKNRSDTICIFHCVCNVGKKKKCVKKKKKDGDVRDNKSVGIQVER